MPELGKFLGPPQTANYRPAVLGYGMIQSLYTGQVPLFMLGEVEAMRSDPQVQLAVALLRAPLHRLQWKVTCPRADVRRFVEVQFRKVWNTSLRKMIHYVEYGNAAGESLYGSEGGYIVFDQLRDVYPRDAQPLMLNGGIVGIQVKGGGEASIRLDGNAAAAGILNLYPPRAFWVAHRPRNGSPYGYSRYNGAWWPWLEKRGRHGATDVRRMWYVKNAFRGMRIRHPPGLMERPDGSLQSCQDYAREIVEKAETGGVLALPNAKDPTSGEYLWVVEDASINGDLTGVREYSRDLDEEILQGFEIPPEVARAAETGSGWSGRSVPFLVFLSGEDELAAELTEAIVRWILRPLVEVNFGPGIDFGIEPVSLTELLEQPKPQGNGQSEGGQSGQPNPAPPAVDRPLTAQRVRMSLEPNAPDRAAVESANRLVDSIIEQGSQVGVIAADEVRRRVRRLLKKKLPTAALLTQARKLLARYEPILASAFSDSLLAAWLAGGVRATRGLPSLPSLATESDLASLEGKPPEPPAGGGWQTSEGGEEPVVHLPIIEAATRDLAARHILTRPEFDLLADEAKTTAFTAARVASEEALSRLAEALSENVAEGSTLAAFSARVEEALGEGALSPGHIENIFRTNVSQAYTTGLMEVLAHPLVADEFPYLAYHAVHDSRVRPDHLALERLGLDGTNIFRRDDPLWQRFTPPWDYQCRCAIVPMSVEDAAATGVREAREWLGTGLPPVHPEWVPPPPFEPPVGWNTRLAVRFSLDAEGHPHGSDGRFVDKGKGGSKAACQDYRAKRKEPEKLSRRLWKEVLELPLRRETESLIDAANEATDLLPADPLPEQRRRFQKVRSVALATLRRLQGSGPGEGEDEADHRANLQTVRRMALWAHKADKRLAELEKHPGRPTRLSLDDEGHDHAQAGSSKGGQFVKKGGASASSTNRHARRGRGRRQGNGRPSGSQPQRSPDRELLLSQQSYKLEGHLRAAKSVPKKEAKVYRSAATRILGRMTHEGLRRIKNNVASYYFYPNQEAVARAGSEPNSLGFYRTSNRTLHLDGGEESASLPRIYAHEYTHALDGPDDDISGTEEWMKAWQEEIVSMDALGGRGSDSPDEGLAELGELMLTGRREEARRYCPKCTAYWEGLGL